MDHVEVWKLLTEWAKIVGALVTFVIGLRQYRLAQTWKRREFVASQIKEIESDKKIQSAMTMLDWSDRTIAFPSETEGRPIIMIVNQHLLCSALLPLEKANGYTEDEMIIRDILIVTSTHWGGSGTLSKRA